MVLVRNNFMSVETTIEYEHGSGFRLMLRMCTVGNIKVYGIHVYSDTNIGYLVYNISDSTDVSKREYPICPVSDILDVKHSNVIKTIMRLQLHLVLASLFGDNGVVFRYGGGRPMPSELNDCIDKFVDIVLQSL